MRSHGFRDRIFFQQHRDRTAGPALSRFCTIPADEHICPAAVQQGAQDPQGLPFKSQFLFPEGRFVCLIRGIQAPPLRVEDKDMAFVRPVRHQSQGIQHPVQRRRIRHGLRPDRLQDDDCQLRGESCTRAWRMQENCSSCRASSVSRSWRRATALSSAEHAPFPCKDKPPKSTVSSRKTNAATATAACRARPVALWRS